MLRTFAVIGDPIDHSLSPTIHNAAYRHLDLECTYIGYKINKNELESGIQSLKSIKISGFNVTIPYKERIIKKLDSIDEHSKKIGAVNCVTKQDNKWIGKNTDWTGFIEPLLKAKRMGTAESDIIQRPVIIGYGGAAKAVIYALQKQGALEIKVFNRTYEKIKHLNKVSQIKKTGYI